MFRAPASKAMAMEQDQQWKRPVTLRARDIGFDVGAGARVKEPNGLPLFERAEALRRDDPDAMTAGE